MYKESDFHCGFNRPQQNWFREHILCKLGIIIIRFQALIYQRLSVKYVAMTVIDTTYR